MITEPIVGERHSIERELKGLGFRGKTLQDIRVLITTKEEMEELEAFILNSESKYKNTLSLVNGFRLMKMKVSSVGKFDFIYGYPEYKTMDEKVSCLQNLFKCYIEERDVLTLDRCLKDKRFPLDFFYDAHIFEPLLPIRRVMLEAEYLEMESNSSPLFPEPTDW